MRLASSLEDSVVKLFLNREELLLHEVLHSIVVALAALSHFLPSPAEGVVLNLLPDVIGVAIADFEDQVPANQTCFLGKPLLDQTLSLLFLGTFKATFIFGLVESSNFQKLEDDIESKVDLALGICGLEVMLQQGSKGRHFELPLHSFHSS